MVLFASRGIVLASALVYLTIAALAAIGPLWVAWQAAEQDARQTATKASAVVAERVERTLTATHIVLARLAETARAADGPPSASFGHPILEGAALTLPEPGSLWVIDGHGDLIAQSVSRQPINGNFSDREYFQPHRSGMAETYVSGIVAGRITKQYHWLISRALRGPLDNFAGVALAALDADAFADFFASLDLGPNATIAVRRGDGTLLLREPLSVPLDDAGREIERVSHSSLLASIAGDTFRVASDGVLRTYSTRTLPGHDVSVYVGVAMTDLTAAVWEDAAPFVFAIAGMSLPMIVLFGIAYRTIKGDANQRIALVARTEDLEETVRQRTQEMEIQAAKLRQSNSDLERFAYSVSHDLQEPLRMVSSFLTLLERHAKDKLDDQEHEFVGYAVDGAERMRGMIAGLLAYSRVETQGRPPQEIDATDAVETARANLGVALSSSGTTLEVAPLPCVRADAGQLISLFQNLIGNAIKYRHPDRANRVVVAAERQGDCWRFTVADNGLGIPEDQHDRIFDVFYRLHARDAIEGTGIGLALCRRIVERHGGTIRVMSTEKPGTTLAFTLPAADSA